ncbi:MAG: rod shape-determining protein MreC [Acidimicrobiales bacterium]
MAAPTQGGRTWYTLGLLVLSALTLLTLDFRGFGPIESAQGAARDIFSPVRSVGAAITKPISNGFEGLFNYGDLERENAELRALIAQFEGESFQEDVDRFELEQIRRELSLDYLDGQDVLAAEVITGPVGNFASLSVEIDRGSSDGVREGMPVVTGSGLVGRVSRVDSKRSLVQLITDADFTVGVRITDRDEVGLAHGNGSGSPRSITVDQGIKQSVAVGDLVVTSGGRSSRFPPGLLIGIVSNVIPKDRGLELEVELNTAPAAIGFVNVVLFEVEEEQG